MTAFADFFFYFLLICAAVALTTSACRGTDRRLILREPRHFLQLMVLGILVFSLVIVLLEKAFLD